MILISFIVVLFNYPEIRRLLCVGLVAITLYPGIVGHTFMKPDTEGGRMHRGGRDALKDRYRQIVHVMDPKEGDPEYTTSWAGIAAGLSGINVILPTISDFFSWSEFLLPQESGGGSTFYKVPDKKCCFKGPTHCNDWLITNCHIMNFGYGEDSTGKVVKHNGVRFCRDGCFLNANLTRFFCRQPEFMEEETWREARKADTWEGRPRQKQLTLNEVAPKKVKDLYELNVRHEQEGKAISTTAILNLSPKRTARMMHWRNSFLKLALF